MTLAADLLLLAIDPGSRSLLVPLRIDNVLRAADLVELAIAERVEVVDGRLRVRDPAPTGDERLDRVLASLAAGKPRRARFWVQAAVYLVHRDCLAVLESEGAIRIEQRQVRRFISTTEYTVLDTERRQTIRARIDAVAAGAEPRTAQDRALACLASACGLSVELFRIDDAAVRERLMQVSRQDDPASDALRLAAAAVRPSSASE